MSVAEVEAWRRPLRVTRARFDMFGLYVSERGGSRGAILASMTAVFVAYNHKGHIRNSCMDQKVGQSVCWSGVE